MGQYFLLYANQTIIWPLRYCILLWSLGIDDGFSYSKDIPALKACARKEQKHVLRCWGLIKIRYVENVQQAITGVFVSGCQILRLLCYKQIHIVKITT